MKVGRGTLTKEVNKMARKFFGRDLGDFGENRDLSSDAFKQIQTDELRLIPYIQYVLANSQKIDQRKLNDSDRSILKQWERWGHFKRERVKGQVGVYKTSVTKEFWDFMCAIIWQSYVLCEGTPLLQIHKEAKKNDKTSSEGTV